MDHLERFRVLVCERMTDVDGEKRFREMSRADLSRIYEAAEEVPPRHPSRGIGPRFLFTTQGTES